MSEPRDANLIYRDELLRLQEIRDLVRVLLPKLTRVCPPENTTQYEPFVPYQKYRVGDWVVDLELNVPALISGEHSIKKCYWLSPVRSLSGSGQYLKSVHSIRPATPEEIAKARGEV